MAQIEPKATETPVDRVLRLFGTARSGAIVNLTTDALKKWNRPLSKKGGGGLVPARHQATYLREAQEAGLPLTPADLIAEPRP